METLKINLPFQIPFFISTNVLKIEKSLKIKYGKYCTDSMSASDNLIYVNSENSELYTIIYKQQQYQTNSPVTIISHLIAENKRFSDNIWALHGAAIEHQGKAHLLLAPTTTGKTTLTAYLVHKGMSYITDDCILLERENKLIHPVSTPLHIRENGLKILSSLKHFNTQLPVIDELEGKRFIYTPFHITDTPLPLGNIFFLTRTTSINSTISVTHSEKIIQLLKSPLTNYTITKQYLSFVAEIAKYNCIELQYCDMEYAYEVIKTYG